MLRKNRSANFKGSFSRRDFIFFVTTMISVCEINIYLSFLGNFFREFTRKENIFTLKEGV